MIEKRWDPGNTADRLQIAAIRQRRPLNCVLELTYRCNFRCPMCYVRMTDAQAAPYGRLRTADEWLDMARQLYDAGVLYLTLTGGECTLYPGFARLYEQLARMGFRLSIMSNAGAYTDELRELFTRFPPYGAAVTMYGGSDETYRLVTGAASGYSRTVSNIRFFRSIGVPVYLNYTMIRQNAADYPLVAETAGQLGLPFTLITDITPHRYDRTCSDPAGCRLTPAERACVACHKPDEVELALENAKALGEELVHFRLPDGSRAGPAGRSDDCIGSASGCAIAWNGDMQTCISLCGYQPVHPFEIGFEAAWAQLKAAQAQTFARPAECRACEMSGDCMHNCAGRRFEGTGTPHGPDPDCCRYSWLLRLYKARTGKEDLQRAPGCV